MNSHSAKRLVYALSMVIIALVSGANGQEILTKGSYGSIENEIKAYEETDLSLLGKSRAVLIKALADNDTAKARIVLKYMQGKFDTSKVVILYPLERILVDFWLRDYQSVFTGVLDPQFDNQNYENKIVPQRDLVYNELKDISRNGELQLSEGIRLSSLPSYKRDFLALLLKSFSLKNDIDEESSSYWGELNRLSDEYLSFYKDSEFNPFIHKYLRFLVKTSPWGYGYELSVGYLSLPAALSRHIDGFGLLSMAFESSYKNIYGCLRLDIGLEEKIRHEFSANGTWDEGLTISHVGALLAFGPMISLANSFTLTPNLGMGYLDFSPPEQVRNKFGQEVSFSFPAWALGLNVDVPLGGEESATFLRFNIGHRSAMTNTVIAKGGYTFITIGIDLFGRPKYRDF